MISLKVVKKKETVKNEEGQEVEPEADPPIANLPDTISDSKLWLFAGVDFGNYDTMVLSKSLKSLVVKFNAS
jgi:hypothetical protein